jgi:hypothetical protein
MGKKTGQVLVRTPGKEKFVFQPKKWAMSDGVTGLAPSHR